MSKIERAVCNNCGYTYEIREGEHTESPLFVVAGGHLCYECFLRLPAVICVITVEVSNIIKNIQDNEV